MKAFRLPLAVLAASLALAACEYRNETATSATPSQASLPDTTVLREPATNAAAAPAMEQQPALPAPAAAAVEPTPAPAQSTTTAEAPPAAVPPDTNTMGAQPAAGLAAAAPSDGVAAQTELGRFLEETAAKQAQAADQPATKDAAKTSETGGRRKAS